jgi:hypothetical protein
MYPLEFAEKVKGTNGRVHWKKHPTFSTRYFIFVIDENKKYI